MNQVPALPISIILRPVDAGRPIRQTLEVCLACVLNLACIHEHALQKDDLLSEPNSLPVSRGQRGGALCLYFRHPCLGLPLS
jgi:hypothetical protein